MDRKWSLTDRGYRGDETLRRPSLNQAVRLKTPDGQNKSILCTFKVPLARGVVLAITNTPLNRLSERMTEYETLTILFMQKVEHRDAIQRA